MPLALWLDAARSCAAGTVPSHGIEPDCCVPLFVPAESALLLVAVLPSLAPPDADPLGLEDAMKLIPDPLPPEDDCGPLDPSVPEVIVVLLAVSDPVEPFEPFVV